MFTSHKIKMFSIAVIFLVGLYQIKSAYAEEKFKVVTTFTVIADMAKNVAGESAEVVSITKPGSEIHGYQPTPKDIVKAQGADLILWNGLNLELWFEQFFNTISDVPGVTLTDGIKSISISEGEYLGKPNPHAWMSLDNALIYVDNIRDALSLYDNKNAEKYAQNAVSYKEKIVKAILPLKTQIKSIPKDDRWLVSCEGAFSYLTQDFDMHELYLWPINAESQGTPKQIRKVVDTVRDKKIKAVFCESTVSQKPAMQIARETGSTYGGTLYVDSLTGSEGKVPTFLDLLRVTAENIVTGLSD